MLLRKTYKFPPQFELSGKQKTQTHFSQLKCNGALLYLVQKCDHATHLVELSIFNDRELFDNIAQIVAPMIKGDTDRKNKYQITDELHDYMEELIEHYQEEHDCSKPLEALTLALLQGGFCCCNGEEITNLLYERAKDGAIDRSRGW